jgi:hypothetical protein
MGSDALRTIAGRRCFMLYLLIHRLTRSASPTAISLSSIIRETPQNYNNYIHAFRQKEDIHGDRESCFSRSCRGDGLSLKESCASARPFSKDAGHGGLQSIEAKS